MRLRLEEQQREVRRAHLDLLLDGAVAETLGRLAVDPRFSGVAPRPYGDGEGWSEVERLGAEHARVEAGARLGPRQASGRAVVRLVPGSAAGGAMGARTRAALTQPGGAAPVPASMRPTLRPVSPIE